MVSGIEQRLDYSAGSEGVRLPAPGEPACATRCPEAAPVPVVLWLSRMASAALPAEAPDLWHWRAASFDFTGDEAPRLELLRELTTHRHEDEDGLSGEQRRARIQMLEELLAELERGGPSKSKRQAAERANILAGPGNRVIGVSDARLKRSPASKRLLEVFREIGDQRAEGGALGQAGLGLCRSGRAAAGDRALPSGAGNRARTSATGGRGLGRDGCDPTLSGPAAGDLSAVGGAGKSCPAVKRPQTALR